MLYCKVFYVNFQQHGPLNCMYCLLFVTANSDVVFWPWFVGRMVELVLAEFWLWFALSECAFWFCFCGIVMCLYHVMTAKSC